MKIITFDPNDQEGFNFGMEASETPRFCSQTKTQCIDDSQCISRCLDAAEMSCQHNGSNKVCLPSVAKPACALENGGVYVWSGFGASNTQGWQCLCSQPQIAAGPGCSLNPGVCQGGVWSYDAQKTTDAPGPQHCQCPPDKTRTTFAGNVPACV